MSVFKLVFKKNIFYFLVIVLLLLSSIVLSIILQANDLSTNRLEKDFQNKEIVYLLSYAHGDEIFFKNQLALANSALSRGVDVIVNANEKFIDKKFLEKNKKIFAIKSGAGLWLWKPYIILQTLEQMPKNAILIYLDSGMIICNNVKNLISNLSEEKPIVLTQYHDNSYAIECMHSELLDKFQIDYNTSRFRSPAGIIIVKNTDKAKKFIKDWLDLCENHNYLTGNFKKVNTNQKLQCHQQDQSLLNVAIEKYKNLISYLAFEKLMGTDLIWHHRRNGASLEDKLYCYKSLIPYMKFKFIDYQIPKNLIHFFLNNPLMKYFRKYFIYGSCY